MRLAPHSSRWNKWFALAVALAAGLCQMGTTVLAQAPSAIRPPVAIDEDIGPCGDVKIAAQGANQVAVAWVVTEGSDQGVHVRLRQGLLWDSIRRMEGEEGGEPRDLALTYDTRGRLHLVWTALLAQGGRGLFHARMDGPGSPLVAQSLTLPTTGSLAREADFPELRPLADGAVALVWQENESMRFSIRAVRLSEAGVADLGRISGESLSGMTPQLLEANPLEVAWYEIFSLGGQLRVDRWQAAEGRWRPSASERLMKFFPAGSQPLLRSTEMGLVGCWLADAAGGAREVHVGLRLSGLKDSEAGIAEEVMANNPSGDAADPNLAGTLPGRLTVAWQSFGASSQAIHLASVFASEKDPVPLTLSTPDQRFAARPAHATVGNWTGAVWTDDARDGGDGRLYFSEVEWGAVSAGL